MNRQDLAAQAERVAAMFDAIQRDDSDAYGAAHSHAAEFLRRFAGADSEFLGSLKAIHPYYADLAARNASAILRSFRLFVEEGLHQALSPEQEAQLEVVSDLLDQARQLLSDNRVHPAAPIVLAGATLEEFLRRWADRESIDSAATRNLSTLASALRARGLISKQDEKEIISWAGLRNAAAHGDWDTVSDRQRARIMLESVSLFLRQHSHQ